ncbi:hypothetical protein DERP_002728 [Dermatophagoides pteronyssinus]|uniref:BHLH domain-containing protein n=1 Tax=Dermatophagoides pteronyssinus TaxID=6956 RepID=A0ABQ8JVN4_DERPT|nr:hypothetical protein DERP_002728 [Dermatophagoides pteronyssinus]
MDIEKRCEILIFDDESQYIQGGSNLAGGSGSDSGGRNIPSAADRRAHHNALERKRRDHIKDSFSSLRDSVPSLHGEKASRAQILKKAAEYIQFMRKKNTNIATDIEEIKKQNKMLEEQTNIVHQRQQQIGRQITTTPTIQPLTTQQAQLLINGNNQSATTGTIRSIVKNGSNTIIVQNPQIKSTTTSSSSNGGPHVIHVSSNQNNTATATPIIISTTSLANSGSSGGGGSIIGNGTYAVLNTKNSYGNTSGQTLSLASSTTAAATHQNGGGGGTAYRTVVVQPANIGHTLTATQQQQSSLSGGGTTTPNIHIVSTIPSTYSGNRIVGGTTTNSTGTTKRFKISTTTTTTPSSSSANSIIEINNNNNKNNTSSLSNNVQSGNSNSGGGGDSKLGSTILQRPDIKDLDVETFGHSTTSSTNKRNASRLLKLKAACQKPTELDVCLDDKGKMKNANGPGASDLNDDERGKGFDSKKQSKVMDKKSGSINSKNDEVFESLPEVNVKQKNKLDNGNNGNKKSESGSTSTSPAIIPTSISLVKELDRKRSLADNNPSIMIGDPFVTGRSNLSGFDTRKLKNDKFSSSKVIFINTENVDVPSLLLTSNPSSKYEKIRSANSSTTAIQHSTFISALSKDSNPSVSDKS